MNKKRKKKCRPHAFTENGPGRLRGRLRVSKIMRKTCFSKKRHLLFFYTSDPTVTANAVWRIPLFSKFTSSQIKILKEYCKVNVPTIYDTCPYLFG